MMTENQGFDVADDQRPEVIDDQRLKDTDRFLKTKRNLMFWASVLIVVACSHNGGPIGISTFEYSLTQPAWVAEIGLLLLVAYHAVGFAFDRRNMMAANSDFAQASTKQQRRREIKDRERLNGLVGLISSASENFRENMRETLKILDDVSNFRDIIKSAQKYASSSCDNIMDIVSSDNPREEQIRKLRDFARFVEGEFANIDEQLERLDEKKLRAKLSDMSKSITEVASGRDSLHDEGLKVFEKYWKIRKRIDNTERLQFQWYDTAVPCFVVILAIACFAIDVAKPSPLGLIAWVRHSAATNAPQCAIFPGAVSQSPSTRSPIG